MAVMLIAPRYDNAPIIAIDGPIDDQRETLVRQRQRMVTELADLTDDEWRTPSRCEGWTAQDVIAHLISTNDFWRVSIEAGVAGSPTRFLAGFDPKATPAELVRAMQSMSPSETFTRFVVSTDALCAVSDALDDAGWAAIAEAPPGHLPVRILAHHALWDAWVHERDILLPLGVAPAEETDEIVACLRYAAALGPAFAIINDTDRHGVIAIDAWEPSTQIVIEVAGAVDVHDGPIAEGTAVLRGRAVDLVEMLSIRAPFDQAVPEDARWMLDGLADVFETIA